MLTAMEVSADLLTETEDITGFADRERLQASMSLVNDNLTTSCRQASIFLGELVARQTPQFQHVTYQS